MGATAGGNFGINIGHGETGSAVDHGGLLERVLRLQRADAAHERAGGFHRRGRDAEQHRDWLAFGRDDQVVLAG